MSISVEDFITVTRERDEARAEVRALEKRTVQLCASYLEQLAAMTAARNEACDIASIWIRGGNSAACDHRERIAEIRKVKG